MDSSYLHEKFYIFRAYELHSNSNIRVLMHSPGIKLVRLICHLCSLYILYTMMAKANCYAIYIHGHHREVLFILINFQEVNGEKSEK